MEAAVDEILDLVDKSNIVVPKGSYLELYHHLGPDLFRKTGAAIITCFNLNYCKKFIILLPGQTLPAHYHKVKEETFTLLYGDATVGRVKELEVGETYHVPPARPHTITTREGCVIEEISTRYLEGDSTYGDNRINRNPHRKTKVREF